MNLFCFARPQYTGILLIILFFVTSELFAVVHKTIPASETVLAFVEFTIKEEENRFIVIENAKIKALKMAREHICAKRAFKKGLGLSIKAQIGFGANGQSFVKITTKNC